MKLKVFTAFSGYDSQCMALDRLGIDYELVGWSEIDKYAIMAHNAVYPQWNERNFGDISKIDWRNVLKYLLMENVKALAQKKFLPYLNKWHSFLTQMGYTNFTQILNSKNFGVPQNRERLFMVSILGDAWFDFPKPFLSDKRIKDFLEQNVDDTYSLSQRSLSSFLRKIQKEKGSGFAKRNNIKWRVILSL